MPSETVSQRITAARELGDIGAQAKAAVPALIEALVAKKAPELHRVSRALGESGGDLVRAASEKLEKQY